MLNSSQRWKVWRRWHSPVSIVNGLLTRHPIGCTDRKGKTIPKYLGKSKESKNKPTNGNTKRKRKKGKRVDHNRPPEPRVACGPGHKDRKQ